MPLRLQGQGNERSHQVRDLSSLVTIDGQDDLLCILQRLSRVPDVFTQRKE